MILVNHAVAGLCGNVSAIHGACAPRTQSEFVCARRERSSQQLDGMQAACMAFSAPVQIAALKRARQYESLANTSAAAVVGEQLEGNTELDCALTADVAGPRVVAASKFTEIHLGPFHRIYTTEAGDSVLTALCVLMATVATGAVLSRLVRMHRGAHRSESSLAREHSYANAFQIRWQWWRGRICACCGASHTTEKAKTFTITRAASVAVFVAALVWIALETLFIFLALPRTVDIPFGSALEHVVVDTIVNLGPPAPNGCRAITWSAGNVQLDEALSIQRCATFARILPGTKYASGAETPNQTYFELETSSTTGALELTLPPSATDPGQSVEVTTHVYRRNDRVVADAPITPDLDFAALEPHFAAALARTPCPLVPGVASRCANARATFLRWTLDCKHSVAAAEDLAIFSKLGTALQFHVDLRIAAAQTRAGFAATLLTLPSDAAPDTLAQRFQAALLRELTGDAVVARAKIPRVNLLAAALCAAAAVVVYLVAQIADESAVQLALECKTHHSGGKDADGDAKVAVVSDSAGSASLTAAEAEERAVAKGRAPVATPFDSAHSATFDRWPDVRGASARIADGGANSRGAPPRTGAEMNMQAPPVDDFALSGYAGGSQSYRYNATEASLADV